MSTRTMLSGLVLVISGFSVLAGPSLLAQNPDDDVRGAFLTTRTKSTEKSGMSASGSRPSRRRPKPTENKPIKLSDPKPTGPTVVEPSRPPKIRQEKLGLGLTLFMRGENGMASRVDPSRAFQSGDRVRVLLETNTDGYLYIFNTTDNGVPVMIYPSAELDEGGNYIQSHIPFEIPSSVSNQERLRWLTFDQNAGTERLFFVFTREPLTAVLTEDDLIRFCKEKDSNCPIRPSADLWSKVQAETRANLQVAKADKYGTPETSGEQVATTRGLGLSKEDPEPSLVMMTASANTNMLVALLELIHK